MQSGTATTDIQGLTISLENEKNFVFLESNKVDGENIKSLLFVNPIEILQADTLDEIPSVFKKIDVALQKGHYLAGFLTYECGYHFEELLYKGNLPTPLLWFGVYKKPEELESQGSKRIYIVEKSHNEVRYKLENIIFSVSGDKSKTEQSKYSEKISRIREYIREGDIYQANFTGRMVFEFNGTPALLYETLTMKQRVGYAAYIQISDRAILSISPELFFRRKGNTVAVKPMKGTAKRGRTIREDEEIVAWLTSDKKNRAENVMIVDVLRNDLGKVSNLGSVNTSSLYEVEKYDTLFQMTSTIQGELRGDISYYELFKALFPSGSVTGAPKRRAMEIIQELETTPRGIYTGAIGYISPDNEAVFNVGIRTIELTEATSSLPFKKRRAGEDTKDEVRNYNGIMGTGGGIVWDSNAEDELKECELKAQFLTQPYEEFQLIETMLWKNGIRLLDVHLQRLQESSKYFDFLFDEKEIREKIHVSSLKFQTGQQYKVRLTLDRFGRTEITANLFEENLSGAKLFVTIAPGQTNSSDRFLFHKTTRREVYNEAYEQAKHEGLSDMVFLNERGEVTEGSISNIFIKIGSMYVTPPVECGLLNGVYRRYLLNTLEQVQEKVITPNDLLNADAIYLCNALRGLQEVSLT